MLDRAIGGLAAPLALTAAVVLALSAIVLHPGTASAQATTVSNADAAAQLAAVKAATERFRDVNVALAEGYVPDPNGMCVMAGTEGFPRQLGGMGIHYARMDLLGITATEPVVDGNGTHTDFMTPAVLVYVPDAEGHLELAAVENLVFQKAWHAAGHTEGPEFLGNQYYSMVENPETEALEAHGFAPHYELHMWLFRDNPAGMFVPFNPDVTCPDTPVELPGAATAKS